MTQNTAQSINWDAEADLVVLAGYMRIVAPAVIRAFPYRIINLHPALLPSFPGTSGITDALKYGVRVTGVTVHFVDEGTDTGPIIAQAVVPVLPTDDEESLGQRILIQEHRIYPWALRLLAEGRVRREGRRVLIDRYEPATLTSCINPPPEEP
jgi:phosphoribosylglycinamide formyltransferase-1